MKQLLVSTTLLIGILWMKPLWAQENLELSFLTGAKYQSPDFTWPYETDPTSLYPNRKYYPILQADFLLQQVFKNDFMKWEVGLTYTHIRSTDEPTLVFPDGNRTESTIHNLIHQLGLKGGLGFHFHSRHRKSQLDLLFGGQCRVPLSGISKVQYQGGSFDFPIYGDENFERLTYYGLYLRPAYRFSFSRKRSNPWRFNLYAEVDALIQHKSKPKPKFLLGGGLGVSYRIGNAF